MSKTVPSIGKDTVAESVPFDNDSNGFVADNVQQAIEEASEGQPIEALTEFESFSSPNNQNTTSNGWVTKSGYPYTSSIKSAGRYIIDFTCQVGQSDKEKQVGTRFQFRLGTSGSWANLGEPILDAVSTDNAYQYRTSFFEITLPTDGVFQVRILFGQTDDGGTGRIREANIKIGKVAG